MCNKGKPPNIYKEFLKINDKINGKNINKQFTEEQIQVANKLVINVP